MNDLKGLLSNLRRPKLLVRAARHGLSDYDRTRDLKRITGTTTVDNSKAVISRLLEQEEFAEANRRTGNATYSISRHIEVLVALMHECRILPQHKRLG